MSKPDTSIIQVEDLYNEDMDLANYSYYQKVMNELDAYFFERGNFPLIETYMDKRIPNLSMNIATNEATFDAYNAGILLANFDSVMQEYYSDILNINYNTFNDLRSNTGENKYTLRIEGLKTEYFRENTHAAEGSETAESKLVKLIVSTIPMYNKKNEKMGMYMEMKDFYLFAAQVSEFEINYGNKLKNKEGSTFQYFNEDPGKGFK